MRKLKSKKKQQTLDLIQFFRYLLGSTLAKVCSLLNPFFFMQTEKKKDEEKGFRDGKQVHFLYFFPTSPPLLSKLLFLLT